MINLSIKFEMCKSTNYKLTKGDTKYHKSSVYPHMSIIHADSIVDESASARTTCAGLPQGVPFVWSLINTLFDSSDFGLLGEQSSPKCAIPSLGRR